MAGVATALVLSYAGPVKGYFEQRAELTRQQAHLVQLENTRDGYLDQIREAESADVLEQRARQQGLILPGERAFAIHGELDPAPPPPPDESGGGILGWFSDLI